MTDKEKLEIALVALRKISKISEKDCAKYVAVADGIAIDALVALES